MIQHNAFHHEDSIGEPWALHQAAQSPRLVEQLERLLQHGSNPNGLGCDGMTPLHVAVAAHNLAGVRALIHYGAYLNVPDEEGDTPLHYAVREEAYEEGRALLESKGINVNASNVDGETPLHFAAAFGNEVFVRLFMKHGADLAVYDEVGQTPAHVAIENGHASIALVLGYKERHGMHFGAGTAVLRPKLHEEKPTGRLSGPNDVMYSLSQMRIGSVSCM